MQRSARFRPWRPESRAFRVPRLVFVNHPGCDRVHERLGWREFSEIRGRDVAELERLLRVAGSLDPAAETPESRPGSRRDPVYDGRLMDAVDRFRKEHGLPVPADGTGVPRGLVDRALVEALRAAAARQR